VLFHTVHTSHLQRGPELPDGQVLQHAPLQLVHGVVVAVQQDASGADVQAVCTERGGGELNRSTEFEESTLH